MVGCLFSIGFVKKEKREKVATDATGAHTEGMNG